MPVYSFPSDIHTVLERRRRHNEDDADRVAERTAIDRSRDVVSCFVDATRQQAFEAILATEEEEHPDDWQGFLEELGVQAPVRR